MFKLAVVLALLAAVSAEPTGYLSSSMTSMNYPMASQYGYSGYTGYSPYTYGGGLYGAASAYPATYPATYQGYNNYNSYPQMASYARYPSSHGGLYSSYAPYSHGGLRQY